MRTKVLTTLVVAVVTLGNPSLGAEPRSIGSLVQGPCDRAKQDNPSFAACLMGELDRLDREVVRYMQAARDLIRDGVARASAAGSQYEAGSYREALDQLDIAQSRWLEYREAHCAMMAKQITGSGAGAAPYRCKVRLTNERLREIWGSTQTNLPDPASGNQQPVAAYRER